MTVQDVLNDHIAQELLGSTELARLAYTWSDGTPRVVPIWFHWTGTDEPCSRRRRRLTRLGRNRDAQPAPPPW